MLHLCSLGASSPPSALNLLLASIWLGVAASRAWPDPLLLMLVAQQEEEGAVSGTGRMEMGWGGGHGGAQGSDVLRIEVIRGLPGAPARRWHGAGGLGRDGDVAREQRRSVGSWGARWDSKAAGLAGIPLRWMGTATVKGLGARR